MFPILEEKYEQVMNKKRTIYFCLNGKNKYFWKKVCTFSFCAVYCTTTEIKNIKLFYKKESDTNELEKSDGIFQNASKKTCPECGEKMEEQAESYFMECERCLSKKGE